MVFIAHRAEYPAAEYPPPYRIEENPAGGWDVYLDPPADPLGPPLVEAIDDELEN
jgi:hypothetical protein